MARTKKQQVPTPHAFRFPPDLTASVDELAASLTASDPSGRRWTRTDVVLACVRGALPKWVQGTPPWAEPARAA